MCVGHDLLEDFRGHKKNSIPVFIYKAEEDLYNYKLRQKGLRIVRGVDEESITKQRNIYL